MLRESYKTTSIVGVFKMLKDLLKQGFKSGAQLYFWKEVYLASQTNKRFKSSDEDWKQAYMEIVMFLLSKLLDC